METYKLENNIRIFGSRVATFPNGIKEAFDTLDIKLPGDDRPFYGISQCNNGNMLYIAAALETYDGEGKAHGYETFTIEKGKYAIETVLEWPSKTDTIKGVLQALSSQGITDKSKPFIEIYKSMKEMVCMVKIDTRLELKREFDKAINKFMQLISSLTTEQLNKVPFEGSWTAGGVAEHMVMSNTGFAQIINGPVKDTDRAPDELEETIKKDFDDDSFKMEAPEFVWPKQSVHNKAELLRSLDEVKATISHAIDTFDLTKTCLAFEVPVYGFMTRIEAIWFIICHTNRHNRQLENIKSKVTGIAGNTTSLTIKPGKAYV